MLGKRVKKLIGQKKTLQEISYLCGSSIEDCVEAYENYTGKKIFGNFLFVGNKRQKEQLRKLIYKNQKILLFGNCGVGKSSLPRIIGKEIGYRVIVSYPTKNEQLVKDFAQTPFETKKTIFIVEGDSFYWRSYSVINHYIQESKCPIIIIVADKNIVPKAVSDNLVSMKLFPPTKKEVEDFVRRRYPNWKGKIEDVYDSDMRITFRKIKYGISSYKPQQIPKIDSQRLAYLILQGRATRQDIKNCSHPFSFVLNWLGNNAHKFYSDVNKWDDISFVDAHKYNYKKKYLDGMLLNLGKADLRGKMAFPPIKYKPPKKKKIDWKKSKKEKVQKKLIINSDMIL